MVPIFSLLKGLKTLALGNPLATAAVAGAALFAAGKIIPEVAPGTVETDTDKKVDENVKKRGGEQTATDLSEEQEEKRGERNAFENFLFGTVMGEDAEYEKQKQRSKTGEEPLYRSEGGGVPKPKGSDVVPWSGRSGTSYSQMEIIEGRKLVAHTSVFVRFPIKDRKNEYLLVWTTTPWTLSSNVVVGVNTNLDYVKIKTDDNSIYYFAKDNFEFQRLEKQFKEKKQWVDGIPKLKTIAQIFKEKGGYEELDTIKGSEMVGWKYDGPYDDFEAQKEYGGYPFSNEDLKKSKINSINQHQVIDPGKDNIGNDIVVAGEGTGIVHMAPGCGDIDHKIGTKLSLVNIAPLDDESKFIEKFGWLSGLVATEKGTTKKIIEDLKKRGLLVYAEQYPHVYPHCWRSGDELVFRLVDEWYINMDWRKKIQDIVDDIEWIPDWGSDREHEWLEKMGDWMISKKRFWGLALPIWTFEDGSFYVVGSREELKELCASGLVMPASHSCGHGMLTAENNLQRELLSSKQIIEDKLSCRVNSFVLPYGNANRTVFNKAREHYQYLFRIGCAINVGWRSLSGYSYRIDADEFWAEGRLLPIKRKWYLNHIKIILEAEVILFLARRVTH